MRLSDYLLAPTDVLAHLKAIAMPLDARGDGVADDRPYLQDFLDEAAASGTPVRLRRGATYRLSPAGTKTFANPAAARIEKDFCLDLPDGLDIDWNGATLCCASGTDAVVLSNRRTSSVGDVLTMTGRLTVDGGGQGDTARTVPMVWFYGLRAPSRLVGLTLRNCSYMAGQVAACEGIAIDDLHAQDIRGQGWVLGGNDADQITRCTVGTVTAERIAGYGTFNQPGNGIFLGASDTTTETLKQRNCAGGIKIGPNSTELHVKLAWTDGTVLEGETDLGTQNCGTKVQGDVGHAFGSVSIDTVRSSLQKGAGLYGRYGARLTIGSFEGDRNGGFGLDPDFDVADVARLTVRNLSSRSAGFQGVSIGGGADLVELGSVDILNAARAEPANSFGFRCVSGPFHVTSLTIMNTRGGDNAWQALSQTSDGTVGTIDNYRTNLSDRLYFQSPAIEIRNARLETGLDPLSGRGTLAAKATTTHIPNGNVVSQTVAGGFVEPVILFSAVNDAARTLGLPRYHVAENFTITLSHPAAAGGEVYEYMIVGYRFDATKRAA